MPGGGGKHYGRFTEVDPATFPIKRQDPAGPETVAESIAASRTRGYACIHCGAAVAVISVFCDENCRDACLAECGAGSAVGT